VKQIHHCDGNSIQSREEKSRTFIDGSAEDEKKMEYLQRLIFSQELREMVQYKNPPDRVGLLLPI
jgi:hypothetical protein